MNLLVFVKEKGVARRSLAGFLLLVAACGPITISEITPTTPPTAPPPLTATPSLTPLPTYAPPTETPTPTATPTPDPAAGPRIPFVHTSEEAKAVISNDEEIPWLVNTLLGDFRLGTRAEPLVLSVTIDTAAITWDNWWCATSDAVLQGNLAVMEFKYEINDELLETEAQAYQFTQYLTYGDACQVTSFYLSDWPPGEHDLKYTFSFTGNVSDGRQVYGAGDYVTIYRVTVP